MFLKHIPNLKKKKKNSGTSKILLPVNTISKYLAWKCEAGRSKKTGVITHTTFFHISQSCLPVS